MLTAAFQSFSFTMRLGSLPLRGVWACRSTKPKREVERITFHGWIRIEQIVAGRHGSFLHTDLIL